MTPVETKLRELGGQWLLIRNWVPFPDDGPERTVNSALEEIMLNIIQQALVVIDQVKDDISTTSRAAHQIGFEAGSQKTAENFRDKVAKLDNELKLAQRGLTSGCGCPIGQCTRRDGDTGSCWLQWAEGHLLKRMGSQRIDEVMRRGHHPSRFRQTREDGTLIAPLAPGEGND